MLPSHYLIDEVEELNEIPLEIVEIEKRTQKTYQKFKEICGQIRKFENGDSPKIHIDQAMKDLEKRSKTCSEAWMKVLTDLDSIQLYESQTLGNLSRGIDNHRLIWRSVPCPTIFRDSRTDYHL